MSLFSLMLSTVTLSLVMAAPDMFRPISMGLTNDKFDASVFDTSSIDRMDLGELGRLLRGEMTTTSTTTAPLLVTAVAVDEEDVPDEPPATIHPVMIITDEGILPAGMSKKPEFNVSIILADDPPDELEQSEQREVTMRRPMDVRVGNLVAHHPPDDPVADGDPLSGRGLYKLSSSAPSVPPLPNSSGERWDPAFPPPPEVEVGYPLDDFPEPSSSLYYHAASGNWLVTGKRTGPPSVRPPDTAVTPTYRGRGTSPTDSTGDYFDSITSGYDTSTPDYPTATTTTRTTTSTAESTTTRLTTSTTERVTTTSTQPTTLSHTTGTTTSTSTTATTTEPSTTSPTPSTTTTVYAWEKLTGPPGVQPPSYGTLPQKYGGERLSYALCPCSSSTSSYNIESTTRPNSGYYDEFVARQRRGRRRRRQVGPQYYIEGERGRVLLCPCPSAYVTPRPRLRSTTKEPINLSGLFGGEKFVRFIDNYGIGFDQQGEFVVNKEDGVNVLGLPFGTDNGVWLGLDRGVSVGETKQYGPFEHGNLYSVNWDAQRTFGKWMKGISDFLTPTSTTPNEPYGK